MTQAVVRKEGESHDAKSAFNYPLLVPQHLS